MPQSGFTWFRDEQWAIIVLLGESEYPTTTRFIECDVEYRSEQQEIKDSHISAQSGAVTLSVVPAKRAEVAKQKLRARLVKVMNLLPSRFNNVSYLCQYFKIKFFIEHGLKLN